jgi:hypothetical protein
MPSKSHQDPLRVVGEQASTKEDSGIIVLDPSLNGFGEPTHDLHVLLRHRLLHKPGGFESFGAAGALGLGNVEGAA